MLSPHTKVCAESCNLINRAGVTVYPDKSTKALFMPIFNLLFYLVFSSKRNFCVKKIDRLGSLEDQENKSSRGKLGDISETDPFQNLQLIDFKDLSSEEISCKKN